jgi:hypothetical protein
VKRVAIIQSAYIPWKGFFDLVGRCDLYIIYDSAAYSKGHWHNRNRIKRANGSRWLTIPVRTAGKLGQPIDEVTVEGDWAPRHWSIISEAYCSAPFFDRESDGVRSLYESTASERSLSKINELFIRFLAARLKLKTEIRRDRSLSYSGDRNRRLVELCVAAGATHYLSGPSAHEYLDVGLLGEAGITTEWMRYGTYREYAQPHGPFEHEVSILDALFCCDTNTASSIL